MGNNQKTKDLENFQSQFMKEFFVRQRNNCFLSSITPGGKLANSQEALKIHQKGYICRLTDSLGEIYEGVWSVLGDKEFFRLAEAYIFRNPSKSYNLSDYGRSFPDFLSLSHAIQAYPFIAELARFDLAFHDLFHLLQHESIEPTQLAVIEEFPYSIIKFGLCVSPIKLSFRVYEIWKNRHQNTGDIPEFTGDQYLVLYKQDNIIFVKELEKQSYYLLSALNSGISLGEYLDNNKFCQDGITSLFYFIASARIVTSIQKA